MANITDIAILDAVAIVVLALYSSRLAYLQLHKEKLASLLKKHEPGTPAFDICCKAYSARALLSWVLITLGFVLDLLAHVLEHTHAHPTPYIVRSVDICGLTCFLSGSYVGYSLVRGTDRQDSGKHLKDDWIV